MIKYRIISVACICAAALVSADPNPSPTRSRTTLDDGRSPQPYLSSIYVPREFADEPDNYRNMLESVCIYVSRTQPRYSPQPEAAEDYDDSRKYLQAALNKYAHGRKRAPDAMRGVEMNLKRYAMAEIAYKYADRKETREAAEKASTSLPHPEVSARERMHHAARNFQGELSKGHTDKITFGCPLEVAKTWAVMDAFEEWRAAVKFFEHTLRDRKTTISDLSIPSNYIALVAASRGLCYLGRMMMPPMLLNTACNRYRDMWTNVCSSLSGAGPIYEQEESSDPKIEYAKSNRILMAAFRKHRNHLHLSAGRIKSIQEPTKELTLALYKQAQARIVCNDEIRRNTMNAERRGAGRPDAMIHAVERLDLALGYWIEEMSAALLDQSAFQWPYDISRYRAVRVAEKGVEDALAFMRPYERWATIQRTKIN